MCISVICGLKSTKQRLATILPWSVLAACAFPGTIYIAKFNLKSLKNLTFDCLNLQNRLVPIALVSFSFCSFALLFSLIAGVKHDYNKVTNKNE